jgi:ATP-binding cassette subfamily B protein/subfamily B ATP-binding cassette protein MsbA
MRSDNPNSGFSSYTRLLRYALPYKKLVAVQFLCMLFTVGLGLLKPWPLKVVVDNVLGGTALALGDWEVALGRDLLLLTACLAYVLFHAGESLIQFGSATVATVTSSKMIRDLRSDLLRALQVQSLKFHDSKTVGDQVHRLTANTTAVETAFQAGFMGVVKSSITLLGMLAVMAAMNPPLTLVALAIVPLLLVCIRWYAKSIHRASWAHQTQEGAVSSRAQEILSSIRLVKAFGREAREQRDFDELVERSVGTRLQNALTQNSFGFFVAVILAAGTAALFWFGAKQVQSGALTIGEFLVFNAYLAMLYAPLSVLSYTTSSIQSALGGASRIFEILNAEVEIQDRPDARDLGRARGAVRFENVVFGYDKKRSVLNGINFEVHPGQTLALVGETGGGKSTILNQILRFYEPSEGRVLIDGHDVRDLTVESLRRNIGLVPQDTLLLRDSVRENIAYGRPDATDAEIEEAAQKAEAHPFILQMNEGYDTVVGERGVLLSVGQRQRIAVARAFLKDSQILLLDEPTSALDAQTEAKLLGNLDSLRAGKTVILAAHRLSMVRDADKILVIEDGRIVEEGNHDDLLRNKGPYSRLWNAQKSETPTSIGVSP